jgi:3-oxoacyl-[acyl-carrier protein] reductase
MTGQVISFDGSDLSIWSHPRAVATTSKADELWSTEQFGTALGDSTAWQPLHPDRLGRILQGQ